MCTHRRAATRGFTILEVLIALVVMAFGILAVAGMQLMLSRNSDVAKQRSEATRLAQERMERLRAFDGIGSGTIDWNNLPVAAETFNANTNATFKVTAALGGTTADAMRSAAVTVRWLDRAANSSDTSADADGFSYNQEVVLSSVISKTDPERVGFVTNPLPLNQPLKRVKNRNINLPIPAIDLGNGRSSTQVDANYAIVYSNTTGGVVRICNPNQANATAAQINALLDAGSCTTVTGYIVAGYLGRSSSSIAWPTGINYSNITRTDPMSGQAIRCQYTDALDQNSGTAISNYKYYLCIVPLTNPGDGTAARWSGTLRFGGVTTSSNYVVCRYQYTQTSLDSNERNIQPYSSVSKSIDEQNYWISSQNSASYCANTSDGSLNLSGVSQGVEHQNCRSSNSANHATECPASS